LKTKYNQRCYFLDVAKYSEFFNLTVDELVDFLTADELNIKSEAYLFEVINKWIEFNSNQRRGVNKKLFRSSYYKIILFLINKNFSSIFTNC
jgi:hypothetical protein